eukprot:TRINITY_DN1089_c0_g1_i6.p1 TRINITY_DN1089_c0_g1~~TRINITY_DN1089_c0_g1_i6.p1  ORF type:complete len:169 (-),score=49.71 TRINITY_DN1089_c0_g1_i6:538-1044(-)
MHLFGDAYQRGVAHGRLLSEDLLTFIQEDLPIFYKSEVDQIPLHTLPPWLSKAIKGVLKSAAPAAFNMALGWVWEQQQSFINASATKVLPEMQGIADGICYNSTAKACGDKAALLKTIHHVNMLPELIRMQCSMMGAWGAATPDSSTVDSSSSSVRDLNDCDCDGLFS